MFGWTPCMCCKTFAPECSGADTFALCSTKKDTSLHFWFLCIGYSLVDIVAIPTLFLSNISVFNVVFLYCTSLWIKASTHYTWTRTWTNSVQKWQGDGPIKLLLGNTILNISCISGVSCNSRTFQYLDSEEMCMIKHVRISNDTPINLATGQS